MEQGKLANNIDQLTIFLKKKTHSSADFLSTPNKTKKSKPEKKEIKDNEKENVKPKEKSEKQKNKTKKHKRKGSQERSDGGEKKKLPSLEKGEMPGNHIE